MGLSIEVRNNKIVIVDAKISKTKVIVKNGVSFTFDESFLGQNGVIDAELFSMFLSQRLEEAKIKDKKCHLCLNNFSIIYREIFVPKVDEKRIPFLVRSEMMSALHLTPDYIMDYIGLEEVERNGTIMYRVLGVAVLESVIRSYIEAFKKAKLKITSIDSATNAVIKMIEFSSINETSNQFLVADVHDGNLRLYLFDEGNYVLTRNSKLRNSFRQNQEAYLVEVSDSISKMLQFTFTRNSKGIAKILYVGNDSILEHVMKYVFESLSLDGEFFSNIEKTREWVKFENNFINAVGVLLRK